MANDIENKENEIDDDNINIDDIEGLERDLPSNENNVKSSDKSLNSEEIEPLEILPEGKLKTSKEVNEPLNKEEESQKRGFKERLKDKKNLRILLAVLALLIIAIVAFIYLSTSEEPIEEKPVTMTQTEKLPPLETYEFKLDHINVSRLNKKLENLTKYELLGMTEEEYLKEEKLKAIKKAQEEEELKLRLEKEAQEKLALEKAKEEELALQEKLKLEQEAAALAEAQKMEQTSQNDTLSNEETSKTPNEDIQKSMPIQEEINGQSFLKFVQINTHKKAIYKSYLKELKVIDSRINACRNINNFIEVFVGPLNDNEDSVALIEAIKNSNLSKSVVLIEITKEEFANRCMVYEN
jgi:hypothetical protein